MAKLENTYKWRDMSGGVLTKVSPDITIKNAVPFALNMDFDKTIGFAESRLGIDYVSNQLSAGNSCLGLHNFRDSVGTDHKLIAAFNGYLYDAENNNQLLSGLDTTAKCEFTTFINTILMSNGVNAYASSDGGANWVTSGTDLDVGNFPAGGKYPIEWKDRVYCAVRDELHFTTTPSGGAVSWTGTGSGSIQIEREDGGGTITALAKVPGYLLIFKERSLKRWNFDSTFPDDLVNIGTQSHKSVCYGKGSVFFFYGPKGFYQTNGGYPVRISKPIQMVIDAIPSSYYSSVSGWCDNEYVYWSIGDITIDFGYGYTETHNNVVVRYNIEKQQWSVYKYNTEFKSWSGFVSGNDVLIAAGDNNGYVHKLNSGYDDNGTAITYILQSDELDFGSLANLKTITDKIVVHCYNANGAQLQASIDKGDWKTIGTVTGMVSEIDPPINFTGHTFEFRITDSITGSSCKLRGLDFPSVEVHESFN